MDKLFLISFDDPAMWHGLFTLAAVLVALLAVVIGLGIHFGYSVYREKRYLLTIQRETSTVRFYRVNRMDDQVTYFNLSDMADVKTSTCAQFYASFPASERERLLQFLRFQKMADGVFFAAVEPLYNVLPLAVSHFRARFNDQDWLVYDVRRRYGFYYDRATVEEVSFPEPPEGLKGGWLDPSLSAKDERLFQDLWKTYFKSVAIRERLNVRLHKQNMPVRFWKYLVEKR